MSENPLPGNLASAWKAFLADDSKRELGLDVYPDVFNHILLFPLQRSRETAAMMRLARSIKPKVVMEIGSDKGGSFYHWVKCLPSVKKAICCEIRGTPFAESFCKAFPDVEFLFLPESSYSGEAPDKVRHFLKDDRIDCLFLDGDKENFELDFRRYLPSTRTGSMVFFHDIVDQSTPQFTFEMLSRAFRSEKIIDTSEGREAALRKHKGEVPQSCYDGWMFEWLETSAGVGVLWV